MKYLSSDRSVFGRIILKLTLRLKKQVNIKTYTRETWQKDEGRSDGVQ
jgi:hypothetical protein